jgi:hypothetical protein
MKGGSVVRFARGDADALLSCLSSSGTRKDGDTITVGAQDGLRLLSSFSPVAVPYCDAYDSRVQLLEPSP